MKPEKSSDSELVVFIKFYSLYVDNIGGAFFLYENSFFILFLIC